MPKVDLSSVPYVRRLVYPEPFYGETEGYEGRRVGDAAGLTQFGVNRAVLPPGARTALRHWHEEEDEFVIILSGEVVLCEEGARPFCVPATVLVSRPAWPMVMPSRIGRTNQPCCLRSARSRRTRQCAIRMWICGWSGVMGHAAGSARTERPMSRDLLDGGDQPAACSASQTARCQWKMPMVSAISPPISA